MISLSNDSLWMRFVLDNLHQVQPTLTRASMSPDIDYNLSRFIVVPRKLHIDVFLRVRAVFRLDIRN